MSGVLLVVGTGLRVEHLTQESIVAIREADACVYVVGDPHTRQYLHQIRIEVRKSEPESLAAFYVDGKPRSESYAQMVERTLELVRQGLKVAAVYYGHPGVFAFPSHESIRRAKAEGYTALMLPGISAADCLFADLGVDPAESGCHMLEATDFLMRQKPIDNTSALVLWQIGCIGKVDYQTSGYSLENVALLVEALRQYYPGEHLVTVYQAANLSLAKPQTEVIALEELASSHITPISTLYVPPLDQRTINPAMLDRLGLSIHT
jgi:precorrin-3B methylase